jgi:hypothetical protein
VEHFADYLKQLEARVRAELAKGLDEEAVVNAVKLEGFDDIKSAFYTPSREGTTRAMALSVKKEEGAKSVRKAGL